MESEMREIENLRNAIVKDYPRLTRESLFSFRCHKDVPCFNQCCANVNIFLTPYDIIRLKKNLGVSSTEFLSKYAISPFDVNLKYPVVLLQMEDDENKSCPFVGENGCRVYPDRPWACRIYPIGSASPDESLATTEKEFFFEIKEDFCKGYLEPKEWTIGEWLKDQGVEEYDQMGEYFKELTLHKYFRGGGNLSPQKIEMFFIASYDLDRFREFIFQSSFLEKFDIAEETADKIKIDDIELMKFGHNWLKFALFGEKTISIKEQILQDKKKEILDKSGGK
jgi:Fe-S-cluster containining protein